MSGDIESRTITGSMDMGVHVVDLVHHRIETCLGQKLFKTDRALLLKWAEGGDLNKLDLLVDGVRFILFQVFEGVSHLVGRYKCLNRFFHVGTILSICI